MPNVSPTRLARRGDPTAGPGVEGRRGPAPGLPRGRGRKEAPLHRPTLPLTALVPPLVLLGLLLALPALAQDAAAPPRGPAPAGAGPGQAPAQAVPVEPCPTPRAREVAWAFLSSGRGAPRPSLDREQFLAAEAYPRDLRFPPHRGPLVELCWPPSEYGRPRLVVAVSRAERVVSYTDFEQGFVVARWNADGSPRSEEEVQEEIARRSRYDAQQLEERALRFLRHAYRDFGKRRFRRYRSEVWRSNPIVHQLAWEEEPAEGVLAVYPNRILVGMNPETGQVVTYLATDVEDALRRAPPIAADRAGDLALGQHPGATLETQRLMLILKGGQARPVWLVQLGGERPLIVLVDAQSGAVVDPEES
mgnify:CR=1 FL=1